ncbi:hypothetical protein [Microbacterium sp. ZXX196]|uniref:hypothetical protein n=1 Tax=Microbacterium sp. ZXX196 TaxID=2609291 RepID=UPI0012B9651B|nr:hypothetical protein [Microbacterium sp. ZXX196]MTE22649.1 hypothetical protein [Microbacterium sp. ZXX196]
MTPKDKERDPEYAQALKEYREAEDAAQRDGTPKPRTFKRKGGEIVYSERTADEVRLTSAQRVARAAELRVQRYSWDTIARELGYKSGDVARKAVGRHMARLPMESVETLRQSELEGLDVAEVALADRIRQGDTRAIEAMLKIKHHRARLTRLYDDRLSVTSDVSLVVVQTVTATAQLLKTHPEMTVEEVAGVLMVEGSL